MRKPKLLEEVRGRTPHLLRSASFPTTWEQRYAEFSDFQMATNKYLIGTILNRLANKASREIKYQENSNHKEKWIRFNNSNIYRICIDETQVIDY